ncbi:MAG: hypothetical protein SGPRY_000720 [Prymnesium sp.]
MKTLELAPTSMATRLLFLDIDGVICCNNQGLLEQPKLELLRLVVQTTGAKIVLSTDWRRVPKLKQHLIATLTAHGMEVIGATPQRVGWQPVRPLEILSWLKTYNENLVAADRPIVTEFVAVDDRLLLQEQGGEGLRGATRPCSLIPPHCLCSLLFRTPLIVPPCLALGHFVHTRFISGLTERCAQRMINILSNPDSTAAPAPGVPLASLLPNGLGSASPSRPRLSSSLPPSPTPIHASMSKWNSTAISSHAATPEPRSPTFSGPAKWAEAAAGASHELRATTMTPNERESKRGCDKSAGSIASVSSLAPASNARSSVYCAFTPWHRTLQATSNLPFLLPAPFTRISSFNLF